MDEVGETIRLHSGTESRENVLGYRLVKRALNQCLDYIENPSSTVTDEDYAIYYDFSAARLKIAEEIIDEELPELGL